MNLSIESSDYSEESERFKTDLFYQSTIYMALETKYCLEVS